MDNNELAVVPVDGRIVSDSLLNFEVAPEETEHPNFIESNTSAITQNIFGNCKKSLLDQK